MRPRARLFCALFAVLCLSLLFFSLPGRAATTFTVNSLADTGDATPDGACNDGAGNCTLREAIQEANALAGTDTINITATGTIQLTSALPGLASDMTINGPGASVLSVRGEGVADPYSVFVINLGQTVNINSLTITNGKSDFGGGINNIGTLTLTNCIVSGNSAVNDGGGIFNNSSTLTLTNSTVSGNSGSNGGGITSLGPLTLTNSTVSGNSAGNVAGGILNNGGTLTLTNSTVSGNSANSVGGGISTGGAATLTGVTVTANRTDSDNDGSGTGGGIFIGGGTPLLRNTIVAGNFNEDGATDAADDIQVSSGSADPASSYNLIGTGGAGGLTNGTNNNQVGVASPKLGPLANNGGPTQTHALLLGSPAIDKGNAFSLITDQRGAGFSRTVNDPNIANASDGTDIGAVEVNYAISATAGTPQSANVNSAFATQLKATVTEAGRAAPGISVTFNAPASGASGTFQTTGTNTVTVNADASGVATAPVFTANSVAGGYTVTASLAGGSPSAGFSLTNTKLDQTIMFGALANKTFGAADFDVSAAATSGLPMSFAASGNCTNSGATVHLTGAGSCTVTASQAGNATYNPAPNVQQSFNIAQAGSTTTVTVADATYDGNPHGGTASVTGPASLNQTLTVSYAGRNGTTYGPSTTAPTNAGDYTASASYAGDSNYNPSSGSKDFSIAKANQSITFDAISDKTFGDADFAPGATASSGLPVSYLASGVCSIVAGKVHIAGAGGCTVTAQQAGDSNYNAAADVAHSFTVNKQGQTITFGALPDKTFGDDAFTVSATGGASGNPVTFSSQTPSFCSVSGSTVTLLGAGTCTVRASQAGDSNYNAAPDVDRSFQIAKASTSTALTSSPNPSGVGQGVLYTATVTSAKVQPNGVVRFLADGVLYGPTGVLCEPGVGQSCTAELRADPLSAGNHTITAEYLGNNDFLASAGTLPGGQTIVAGGVIEFTQDVYTVAEGGGSVTVRVVRNGDPTLPVAVDYTTDDGSNPAVFVACAATTGAALERCDYERAAGTLRFAAGEREQTFTVLVNDDSYVEGTESLQLHLSNPTGGAALGATPNATLEITDDAVESAGNVIDDKQNFVRQQYHDFLNREPDAGGLAFWTDQMTNCGSPDPEVCRINVSAAFFLSIEFQQTGYLVERMHKAAYGDATGNSTLGGPHQLPVPAVRLNEFLRDAQRIRQDVIVGQGNWQGQLEANKQAYALEFVQRPEFLAHYPAQTNATAFVNLLDQNAGGVLTPDEKTALITQLSPNPSDAALRASVVRKVAEDADLVSRESNRAFVLMEYFGYLRRNPDAAPDNNHTGYDFWLRKLDQFNGNYMRAEMVKAFLSSDEYRKRFGQ